MLAEHKHMLLALIAQAEFALSLEVQRDVETFSQQTDLYLEKFSQWETAAQSDEGRAASLALSDEDRAALRSLVEKLNALHQNLLESAARQQAQVATRLGDVHRRNQGIRRYVDRAPSRITIAGKREG